MGTREASMVRPMYNNSIAVLLLLVLVLILPSSCNAIEDSNTNRPDEDVVRVPPGQQKLAELERDVYTGSDDGVNGRTQDSTIEEEGVQEDVEEDNNIVEDDDYNVVILADDVPWDLTEDTPDAENELVSENARPTMAPTQVVPDVDDDDYVIIILEDDVPWDDVAVAEYVKDEFEAINNANSNSSEYDDDAYEDGFDEGYPSPVPTVAVFPTESTKPTRGAPSVTGADWTVTPTNAPTMIPSDYPSFLPTNSPSQEPSASPTLSCHDEVSYRSPINGLRCSQHRNTNCLNWRHIGLNMTELEMLVRSCPITCNIECGSFKLFSAPVSFRISRVAGFMDPDDVKALMDFSMNYLEDFVRNYIAENSRPVSNTNANQNDNGNAKIEDGSGSNDIDDESETQSAVVNEDGFFNDNTMDGGAIMFEIEVAELTAQNLVEENPFPVARSDVPSGEETNTTRGNGVLRRERRLRSRSLQDLQRTKQQSSGGKSIMKIDESLDIIITFHGFTIGMNPDKMSELLVSGIEGIDFTRELQLSRIDFFSEATVSSATETADKDFLDEEDIDEDDAESNSTFTVLISYLVPIVVIGFALGSLFYHKCYVKGKWARRHNTHSQNAIERAQIGGMTATPLAATPTNSIVATNGNDEGHGVYFNFRRHASTPLNTVEENENSRPKSVGQGDDVEVVNKEQSSQSAFTRFVTALNLNLAITKSKNSADEEEANDADEASNTTSNRSTASIEEELVQSDGIPIISDDLVSPMSGDSEKNESGSIDDKKFKAYASVLPPMIVIDNIDGPDIASMNSVMIATSSTAATSDGLKDSSRRSSSTPLEELDAFASEFRKQLSRSSSNATNSRHPSYSGSFYGMGSSSALDLGSGQGSLYGTNAEDEDDYRLIKGMVSDDWDGDDLFSPIPSNITTNDGEVENEQDILPHPEQTSSSSDSDQNDDAPLTSPISTPIDAARKTRIYGTWDGSTLSEGVPNLDTKLSSSSMPTASHRGTASDGLLPKGRAALPPKRPPTPERRSSFQKFTPIAQALIGGSSSSTGSEGHRRKSSADTAPDLPKNSSSISALSTDDLMIAGSKSDGSNYNTSRLEFEAPRKGNWGLVLESSSKTGPRIYAVKDYSPLFGLVQKGDKLLEIDGKNVSQSNLTEVTKLLKGKSSSYPYHRPTSTTMPIVISRSSICNIDSSTAIENSRDFTNTSLSSNYNHKRNDSYSSYGSAGSSGSRVVEDVDGDNHNSNNVVYYFDHHQKAQNRPQYQSSFDHDSSNEI